MANQSFNLFYPRVLIANSSSGKIISENEAFLQQCLNQVDRVSEDSRHSDRKT